MRWALAIAAALLLAAATLALVLPGSSAGSVVAPGGSVVGSEASWLGRFTQLVSVIGLPAAVVGLALVYQQLRATHRAQRVEWGPLVRVDVVPSDLTRINDIELSPAYFESDAETLNIATDGHAVDQTTQEISLWLRNLQPHPLGVAYGVRVTVIVQMERGAATWHELEVPYLNYDKAVRLGVVQFPADLDVTAWITSLRYQDLYRTGVRSKWPSGPEAWHGRLVCRYANGVFYAQPVYEPPRGPWLHRLFHRS